MRVSGRAPDEMIWEIGVDPGRPERGAGRERCVASSPGGRSGRSLSR